MSSRLAQIQITYSRFSGDGSSFQTRLFTRQFSCFRFLPVWKSKKHTNRERNSYNHLSAFNVMSFARVCEIVTAVVSEL